MNLRPGQKMQVVEYAGRIELIPERDIKELRGFLKGINTEFKREKDKEYNAIIWTQDSDFKNIGNVKYFPRK